MASTDTVNTALEQAKTANSSLLYVHLHSWNSSSLTPTVLSYFNLSMQGIGGPGNYFSQDKANWSHHSGMTASQSNLTNLKILISHLRDDSFSFIIADCGDGSCTNISAYNPEFGQAAGQVKSLANGFDGRAEPLFEQPGFQLEKLLILLGDKYRENIRYPMDKATTDTGEFLRAYFADHSVLSLRAYNPTQSDLGNFSRTDFSHITPSKKTVSLNGRRYFRSAGVYALPGQTFEVTRTDSATTSVNIFINTQRSASTKEFEGGKYIWPKYLQSKATPIAPGQTLQLTHPYGGPVQVDLGELGESISLSFSSIGLHPHWQGPEDDASFTEVMAKGDFDWAELATEQFEVHSQLDKMRNTLSNPKWSIGSTLASHSEEYVHNYPPCIGRFKRRQYRNSARNS